MFFKKKEKIEDNFFDRRVKEFNDQIGEATRQLYERVEQVIIKQGVINLYPEGPDQKKAIEDCEKAKYSLLCAIGHHDGLMSDYTRYLRETKNERVTTYYWTNNYSSSHQIIENSYKIFLKKT